MSADPKFRTLDGEDRKPKMYARTTSEGTSAGETALCGRCLLIPEAKAMTFAAADSDVVGEYLDASGNEALECQWCGATT